jgi:hypothetical protein
LQPDLESKKFLYLGKQYYDRHVCNNPNYGCMNTPNNKWYILVFIVLSPVLLYAQTNGDKLINKSTTFEFKDDTLSSGTGIKLFIGQKLIIGNAAGEAGQYRSVVSKKAALVPSIWGQDMRYENAIENYVDSKKNKEKLKKSLITGNLLTITKITFSKTGKPYFYLVSLSSDTDGFNCDIKLALILKELLLLP